MQPSGRAGNGKWVTMLMYTENDADAATFRSPTKMANERNATNKNLGQILFKLAERKINAVQF